MGQRQCMALEWIVHGGWFRLSSPSAALGFLVDRTPAAAAPAVRLPLPCLPS